MSGVSAAENVKGVVVCQRGCGVLQISARAPSLTFIQIPEQIEDQLDNGRRIGIGIVCRAE